MTEPNAPQSLTGNTLGASLTVNDLEKSLAWYGGVVGFVVDEKYERDGKLLAASLKAGQVSILLTQDDGKSGWERVKGVGFSLMITTDQSIDDVANGIKTRGGTLLSEPVDVPWGQRMFRLHDPDGFKLTIASERTR